MLFGKHSVDYRLNTVVHSGDTTLENCVKNLALKSELDTHNTDFGQWFTLKPMGGVTTTHISMTPRIAQNLSNGIKNW